MAAGAGAALFTWPKNAPTGTPTFWIHVVVYPALACVILYGLRLLYFERQTDRLAAEREDWEEKCTEATVFAQEPLALLASGYLCALGSLDAADAIVTGSRPLGSQVPSAGKEAIRYTTLSLIDDQLLADRYASCFRELLAMTDDSLRAIPESIPFAVYLDYSGNIEATELCDIWQTCWAQTGHRVVETSVLARDKGVMALDAWLDSYGGPALEKIALFVTVQLHEAPPINSTEAAVALLLGWEPLVQRNGLSVQALLHRPVEQSDSTLRDVVETALLWGRTRAGHVTDVWQTGLALADKPALLDIASEIKLGASQTDELEGFHDIDPAIGHAGIADAWLAVALAAEHAVNTGEPQMVVSRQHAMRLAVVQALPAAAEERTLPLIENNKEGSA
ncbi:hypothetical protein [Paraburkholderia saeva]|uniref:hypothetical protein n=1 Tax=Paraburkholderia saeva TaxID=2777537 RepID=UPI001D7F4DC4|nr:hypothetical protein [Paraburkholderia saeva]CAG4928522.1 hypothetical protein R70241_05739 [Paraburkholderia saeva]